MTSSQVKRMNTRSAPIKMKSMDVRFQRCCCGFERSGIALKMG